MEEDIDFQSELKQFLNLPISLQKINKSEKIDLIKFIINKNKYNVSDYNTNAFYKPISLMLTFKNG